MRLTFVIVAMTALLVPACAHAASAASCSGWRSICSARGGTDQNCGAKFRDCVSSGCFAEIPKYGGAMHCGLTRK
jgi:hypothetical protein